MENQSLKYSHVAGLRTEAARDDVILSVSNGNENGGGGKGRRGQRAVSPASELTSPLNCPAQRGAHGLAPDERPHLCTIPSGYR